MQNAESSMPNTGQLHLAFCIGHWAYKKVWSVHTKWHGFNCLLREYRNYNCIIW